MIRRSLLLTSLLLFLPSPLLAGSITIDCTGEGGGTFRFSRDDDGAYLSGDVRIIVNIDDTDNPGSRMDLAASFLSDPSVHVVDSGPGSIEIGSGYIRFDVTNSDQAGLGLAILRGDWIQPGAGFPNLAGTSGEFQLSDQWGDMIGTMSVPPTALAAVPEPPSLVLLPMGIVGLILAWRRYGTY